jgi:hypothetical protein
MVTLPKKKGGLGALNLYVQNDALLLKHLHKFYAKKNIPWVNLIWSTYYSDKVPHGYKEVGSFWWREVLRLNIMYRGVAMCKLGNGSTVLFWEDLWSSLVLADSFPRLYSYVLNAQTSVKDVMVAEDLESLFSLPLSQEAFLELQQLNLHLQTVRYDVDANDQWTFLWGNAKYSSSKFYSMVFSGRQAPVTFTWLWNSKCSPRLKFHVWLLLVDRLNTKDIIRRRHYNTQAGLFCVMCDALVHEDRDHLFFNCQFAQTCWDILQIKWDDSVLDIHDRIMKARQEAGLFFFMDAFIVATWEVWKLRNTVIFDAVQPSTQLWTWKFKDQFLLQLQRFRDDRRLVISQWLESLV